MTQAQGDIYRSASDNKIAGKPRFVSNLGFQAGAWKPEIRVMG
jgi:hypothetical protein